LGTSVGGCTHLHAFDEGGEHPRLADVLGRGREQVAIENDEIGGLPDLERSGVSLAMVQRGPLDRVGPEQRIDRATRAAPGVPDRSAGTSIASRPTCSPTIWRMLHLLSRETDIRGRAFSRGVLTLDFERRGEPAPAEDGP